MLIKKIRIYNTFVKLLLLLRKINMVFWVC